MAVHTLPKLDPALRLLDWFVPRQTTIPVIQLRHFPGGDGPVWEQFSDIVKQIIDEHNLLSMNEISTSLKSRPEHKELYEMSLKWINPKGGGNLPHLHYKGDVYPVTPTEWNEFSKAAIGKLQQKFTANIGSISFENQCLVISSLAV
jgi:hypothetical protein